MTGIRTEPNMNTFNSNRVINLKFIITSFDRCILTRGRNKKRGSWVGSEIGVQYTTRFLAGEWENCTSRSRVGGLSFQQWAGSCLALLPSWGLFLTFRCVNDDNFH